MILYEHRYIYMDEEANTDRRPIGASTTEVARVAGVSRATVSRVLNGTSPVKPATKLKVEAAVKAVGYRRNPMVQALMSQVRHKRVQLISNIAWLEIVSECGHSPSVQLLRNAARVRAESLGYGFDVIYQQEGQYTLGRLNGILDARGVRGVVLAPVVDSEFGIIFPWDRYAVGTIGRSVAQPGLSYVMMHFQHAMQSVLHEVNARGYSRVAYLVTRSGDLRTEHLPLMAFYYYNAQCSSESRIEPLWCEDLSQEEFMDWYALHRPDIIISNYSENLNFLRKCGLKVPEQVAYVSLSSRSELPAVSGIRVPVTAMAAAAVDLVAAQIQRNEIGLPASAKAILIEGDWWEGSTLPCK
jgi:DNA-binding LacI/PurR family transcriptional regulator